MVARKSAAAKTPPAAKKATVPARRAPRKPAAAVVTTVAAAVRQDLARLAKIDPVLASSGLALSAVALAREIDGFENSATSKSMCARALLETMDRLRELTPVAQEKDDLDDLGARRAARLARRATPAG